MRVVGGTHRGRPLAAPPERTTRPTTDRVRESLFNMLAHTPLLLNAAGKSRVEGGIVLDAFAGSGALSFEALSRGARQAFLFESDAEARRVILRNAQTLKLDGQVILRGHDVLNPGSAIAAADLAFLDPPYRTDLGSRALQALSTAGWLKPDALAIVESAKDEAVFPDLPGFTLLDQRQQGPARLTFLLHSPH